jgi:hypothetical protein
MTLQAAVNGDRSKADHPAVPVTQDEMIRDVRECLAAGASTPGSASKTPCTCPTAAAPPATRTSSPPPATWGQEPPDLGKHPPAERVRRRR